MSSRPTYSNKKETGTFPPIRIYISEELLGVSCVPNVLIQRICTRNRSRIIVRRKYYDSHSLSLHGGNISRTALCKGELLSIELESFT